MIDTSVFNFQIAAQTARGVYPANPAYLASLTSDARIRNAPTADTLNVADGGMWTPSFKRIGKIEAGGSPVILATPNILPLLVYGGMGAISTAGGGDPRTHTITPAASSSSFPYFCVWQKIDTQWELFRDCLITEITVEVSNSDKFIRATPTFVSLQRGQKVAAPAIPATAETDAYHWLDGQGYWVIDGDFANLDHDPLPTDLDSLKTYLAAHKTRHNAHCAVASGKHHKAADAVNVLAYATPLADEAACIAALTEIKTDHNLHLADVATHYFKDPVHVLGYATPCADLAACLVACQEIRGSDNLPGDFNGHLGQQGGVQSLRFRVSSNAGIIYGQDVVPYAVQRKRGVIEGVVNVLAEDWRMYNYLLYGDPAAADGTEVSDEIRSGSLYVKFIASTSGAERSVAITLPAFDYAVESVADISGDPEGGERYMDLGGEAGGTAPIATVTCLNAVASY